MRRPGRADLFGRLLHPGLGSLLQWMFYVGLFITVADVLIALALANYGAKSSAKTAALEQTGVLALAQSPESPRREPGSMTSRWSSCTCASPARLSALRQRRPGHRQRHPARQPHRPQTGGPCQPHHPGIPNRLGAKRFGQRPGAGTVHPGRGQQDLRPEWPGRPADGDPADPQGQQRSAEPDGRHPVESGVASADPGRGAPAAEQQPQPAAGRARRPLLRRRRRNRRSPTGSPSSRSCGPAAL